MRTREALETRLANLQRMRGWQDVLQADLSRQRDEALSEKKVFAGKLELAQLNPGKTPRAR